MTSLGFVRETFDAIVAGTVKAVVDAHNNLAEGSLSIGTTEVSTVSALVVCLLKNHFQLLDANINRSPSAYLANPEDERARYAYDQDKEMTLIKFKSSNGNDKGFLSFFPVRNSL